MKLKELLLTVVLLLVSVIVFAWVSGPPKCGIESFVPQITWNQIEVIGHAYSDVGMDYYEVFRRYIDRTDAWTSIYKLEDTAKTAGQRLCFDENLAMGENVQYKVYCKDLNALDYTDTSVLYQVSSNSSAFQLGMVGDN